MKAKLKKIKKMSALLLAFVMIVTSLNGISAYFTDTDTATNVVEIGEVKIDLTEPNWNNNTETTPNETVPKDPQITNIGKSDAFVYLEVVVPYANVVTTNPDGTVNEQAWTELFNYDINDGWVEVGKVIYNEKTGTATHVYAYVGDDASSLEAISKDETTTTLFDSITMAGLVDGQGYENTIQNVVINAYGIQSNDIMNGETDPKIVWNVICNQSEKVTEGYVSQIPVTALDNNGNDLNATATVITGTESDELLAALDNSGIANAEDVDLLLEVESDDFEDIADTTFDVSSMAKEGDTVIILHYNEKTSEWEHVATDTVDENLTVGGDFTNFSPVAIIVVKRNDSGSVAILKDVVIDYGLTVKIEQDKIGASKIVEANSYATYGNVQIEGDNTTGPWSVIYTPTKILNGVDTVHLFAENGQEYTFGVYPATTVYYEENFMNIENSSWNGAGNVISNEQTATFLGEEKLNYGYDIHYSSQITGPSNGTYLVSEDIGGYAEFTFTGTGTDIYANCSPDSGAINVLVRNSANKIVKMLQINTKMDGKGSATEGQKDVIAYNLPVASIDFGTTYDTYNVQIRHIKVKTDEGIIATPVQLDGFRVYNTLPDSNVFKEDGEANPTFVEMRNMIFGGFGIESIIAAVEELGSDYFSAEELAKSLKTQVLDLSASGSGVEAGSALIIDNKAHDNAYIKDLLDNGPKNEVYLFPGQSLVFKPAAGIDVQLGLKAINAEVTYKINDEEKVISTSTDMFYELGTMDGNTVVTIENVSGGILSVTDLKWIINDTNDNTNIEPLVSLDENDFVKVFMNLGYKTETP